MGEPGWSVLKGRSRSRNNATTIRVKTSLLRDVTQRYLGRAWNLGPHEVPRGLLALISVGAFAGEFLMVLYVVRVIHRSD